MNARFSRTSVALAAAVACSVSPVAAGEAASSTDSLRYAGRLEDANGSPLGGKHDIELVLWEAAAQASTPLCSTGRQPTTLSNGRFAIELPTECAANAKSRQTLFSETIVDGQSLGRTLVSAVPHAIQSQHASTASAATGELAGTLTELRTRVEKLEEDLAHVRAQTAERTQTGVSGGSYASIPGFAIGSGSGDREHLTRIDFPVPYSNPPQVIVGISHLDSSEHTRIIADVRDVDTRGFTLRLFTWSNSQVYGVTVSWAAVPAP